MQRNMCIKLVFAVLAFWTQMAMASGTISLVPGWNLIGNGSATSMNVATTFGDSSKVITVWKWIPNDGKWAFYAPTMSGQALSDYAASKGYQVLTSLEPGEGFWVNASVAFDIGAPSTTSIVGSWYVDFSQTAGVKLPIVLTLLADGTYIMADNGNTVQSDPNGQPGIEIGTYTYNPDTKAFSSECPSLNTNGEWGLSHGRKNGGTGCTGTAATVTIQGNTMTFTTVEADPATFTLTRIGQ